MIQNVTKKTSAFDRDAHTFEPELSLLNQNSQVSVEMIPSHDHYNISEDVVFS